MSEKVTLTKADIGTITIGKRWNVQMHGQVEAASEAAVWQALADYCAARAAGQPDAKCPSDGGASVNEAS